MRQKRRERVDANEICVARTPIATIGLHKTRANDRGHLNTPGSFGLEPRKVLRHHYKISRLKGQHF